MDNFMDKIAQKLNAQEMIRANSAADAAQLEKLQTQTAEYDACMKEMRKLNLKTAENEQKLHELMEQGHAGLKSLTDACMDRLQAVNTENGGVKTQEELDQIKAILDSHMEKTEELLKQSDDFSHKESVKVYRNVQAVIVEELGKQTQALMDAAAENVHREKRMLALEITTAAAVLANIVLLTVHILGFL